jgi:DNA replication protein DnaC
MNHDDRDHRPMDLASAEIAAHAALDAAIPSRYRDARADRPDILAWAAEFADLRKASSLLLLGGLGVGKTWTAYGALRAAVVASLKPNRAGVYHVHGWKLVRFVDFVASMRPSRDGDPAARLRELSHTPILMIDDLGVAKGSEFVEGVVYQLICERYDNERPTIYTSNLLPDSDKPDAKTLKWALGGRITSRLSETCTKIVITGPDRRRTQGANPRHEIRQLLQGVQTRSQFPRGQA